LKWLKEYRLIIMGAAALVLLVIAGRGGPEEQQTEPLRYHSAFATKKRARVAPASESSGSERPETASRGSEPASQDETSPASVGEKAAAEETPADSTGEGEKEEFDPEKARLKAVEEVNAFNEELASTLWSTNPNALKTRLKASELREKADGLDQWIKAQDTRSDMTPQERQEWQAQREVWVGQSRQLKQVAQRLTATRGTKRKVRILAQEIKDRVKE
jgi:hypothetical protein